MTPATMKPVKRLVVSRAAIGDGSELFVAEIVQDELILRPYRAKRDGPATVRVSWGLIYQRELVARAERERRDKEFAKRERRRQARGGRR